MIVCVVIECQRSVVGRMDAGKTASPNVVVGAVNFKEGYDVVI